MIIGQFGEVNPPFLDGVGQVMLAYCRYLKKLGHESIYIAPVNPRYGNDIGCEGMFYPSVKMIGGPYRVGLPVLHPRFRHELMGVDFDIVHAHAPFLAGRAARWVARRKSIPLVATFHSKYYDDVYKATHSKALAGIAVWYVVRFFNTCDEVWTVTDAAAQVLRDYGYQGPVQVMRNGSDVIQPQDVPHELPAGLHFDDDEIVLLFVGQLDMKKNPHLVMRACKILKDKGLKFRYVLVGEGLDHKKLQALASELGLDDQVIFTGRTSDRAHLMSLYRRADLFTFPSLYDTSGLVVREAAMMGTPSLVAQGSCCAEGITDGENGYICPAEPQAIAQRILDALPTCRQVGHMAQKTIPVPWEDEMALVEAAYTRLIEQKK